MLNIIASKGYISIIRRGLSSPRGYGTRIMKHYMLIEVLEREYSEH